MMAEKDRKEDIGKEVASDTRAGEDRAKKKTQSEKKSTDKKSAGKATAKSTRSKSDEKKSNKESDGKAKRKPSKAATKASVKSEKSEKKPVVGKAPKAKKEGKSSKTTPAAKRADDVEEHERPIITAKARYVRTSPRKARVVADQIRGKSVDEARATLQLSTRGVAKKLESLLDSAVANAESNLELDVEDLAINELMVDEGPTLKRFRPRAMGRATPIHKRTSHLTLSLTTVDTVAATSSRATD